MVSGGSGDWSAKSGDVSIAYTVVGEGPFDVVLVPSISHVELAWSVPDLIHGQLPMRLASFARLIYFDRRGMGMSDRVSGAPTLEARMDDIRAVMDAAGSRRAAMFGWIDGAPLSLVFAATFPERVSALVLLWLFRAEDVGAGLPVGNDQGAISCRE